MGDAEEPLVGVKDSPENEIVAASVELAQDLSGPAVVQSVYAQISLVQHLASNETDATHFRSLVFDRLQAETDAHLASAELARQRRALAEQQTNNLAGESKGITDRVEHEITIRRRQRRTIAILRIAGWVFIGAAVLVLGKELWGYLLSGKALNIVPVSSLGLLGAGLAGGASLLPTNRSST